MTLPHTVLTNTSSIGQVKIHNEYISVAIEEGVVYLTIYQLESILVSLSSLVFSNDEDLNTE